ncbi:MAG: DUF6458 family protein [Solirubrobacteraceae bacterium]
MTIGSSIVLIAIGAILKWAVTTHVKGFDIQTAGIVLLIVGIVGLLLSVLYTFVWSRQRRPASAPYVPRDEQETRRYQ